MVINILPFWWVICMHFMTHSSERVDRQAVHSKHLQKRQETVVARINNTQKIMPRPCRVSAMITRIMFRADKGCNNLKIIIMFALWIRDKLAEFDGTYTLNSVFMVVHLWPIMSIVIYSCHDTPKSMCQVTCINPIHGQAYSVLCILATCLCGPYCNHWRSRALQNKPKALFI